MAEIHCPQCGKPNPIDQEVCQFCEARLTTLENNTIAEEKDTSSLTPGETPLPKDTEELEKTLPPWLQEARGQTSSEETSSSSSKSPPDQLSGLEESPKKSERGTFSLEEETELPAWLSSLNENNTLRNEGNEEKDQDDSLYNEDRPSWLQEDTGPEEKKLKESFSEKELTSQQADQEYSKKELPDWFSEMENGHIEENQNGEKALEASWMEDSDEPLMESKSLNLSEGESNEEELPDWILELADKEPDAQPEEKDQAPIGKEEIEAPILEEEPQENRGHEEETSDWLLEDKEGNVEEDLPDWILEEEEPEFEESEEGFPDESGAEKLKSPFDEDIQEEFLEDAEYPDWLREESEQDEEESVQEELPDWLLEDEIPEKSKTPSEEDQPAFTPPFSGGEEDVLSDDIFTDDLPDWLSETSTEELKEESFSGQSEEEITPGELPGWVEAMRPVKTPDQESMDIAEDGEDYIENVGPLAGMPNIIPAEAGIINTEKKSRDTFKLNVEESQKKYVALLDQLIESERKSDYVKETPHITPQRVLKWIIALVLSLSIIVSFLYSGKMFSYPLHQKEVQTVNETIQALPNKSPVLVAFDYEPALSGEMNAIAAGVIDHLMLKGTYLTFVSTSPTGPVLAENFLRTTQAKHNYVHSQQYVNLGYIPGGAAGLLSFVVAPKNIMPLAFDGANAWAMQPLQEINSISDFSLVLVITEDPDTARMWVEQVQPYLESTPLMMAVSAQAEPLVRPYYEIKPQQVSGIIAGLPNGVSYEQLMGRENLSQKYWDAFNFGIVTTILVLVISGVINTINHLFSQNGKDQKENI